MIYGPPYRGWFGWATICVVLFIIAEYLWHVSELLPEESAWKSPLAQLYAPFALLMDEPEHEFRRIDILYLALVHWFGFFLIGLFFVKRQKNAPADAQPDTGPQFQYLDRLLRRFPYQGLVGWAIMCVWLFLASEILYHLSPNILPRGIFSTPGPFQISQIYSAEVCALPYYPLNRIVGPGYFFRSDGTLFFYALAWWFCMFLLGAIRRPKRRNPILFGLGIVLLMNLMAVGHQFYRLLRFGIYF